MLERNKTRHHGKIFVFFMLVLLCTFILTGRLGYLMIIKGEYYSEVARQLHERERHIKAARGRILDRNGVVIADNRAVCTVSVIHNQIENPEEVIRVLCAELSLPEETVRARVEKRSSIEKIKSNVDKEIGDRIRNYNLPGVKVDEDYKRYYPYNEVASKVLGFTGADNQGIIGLEVIYDEELQGTPGTILTMTDAAGVEVENAVENRIEPLKGNDLQISMDMNIQEYATQLAYQAMANNEADRVSIIVMNPQNGELYAMVDVPEFQLNSPYELDLEVGAETPTGEAYQDALNSMWRNGCINDTYEPGSTFKIITTAAGLEEGVVSPEDSFYCPGYIMVEDRRIRCHKTTGHGSETFTQGIMNSCNPVFITVGGRLGVDRYVYYFEHFGLLDKTGVDLPGEAGTIMHRAENMGPVELATVSFGQSFQITPIQLVTTVSMIINGGDRVTPHFAMRTIAPDGSVAEEFAYEVQSGLVSEDTSETVQYLLEQVVSEGTGRNGYVEGFSVGGKTATSQTLPRGSGKYIASFIGFAPADEPEVIALVVIHNPKGVYYGGTIAAPVVRQLFENILPYLEGTDYNEQQAFLSET
ncbi:MAG: peptidoglycan glycosyltransferase [Lachnospiraceae bacterium]|nr:peptidoglycan glycosyltransferase [Lachnospiraceae bacterium]